MSVKHITLTKRSSAALRDAVASIESSNWNLWDKIKWDLSDDEYQRCLDAYSLSI
jgi:hypothetical protein